MFPTVNQGKHTTVASLWKTLHQKFILRSGRNVGGFSALTASQSAAHLTMQQ